MTINAIIDDKYILFSECDVMYVNGIKSDDEMNMIIDIISCIKSSKRMFINLGFINKQKVIMDTFDESLYFYELDGKYKETAVLKPDFISRIINNKKVIVFSPFPNTFSKKHIEMVGEIKEYKGFSFLTKLYDVLENLIEEEKEVTLNGDYVDFIYKNEKAYLKIILEIFGTTLFLDAYNSNFDKYIIRELNKYLTIEECFQLFQLNDLDLVKKLYFKVNNMDIKKDLICMALINSIHNKIEVEKYYFEESLASEYAYLKKGEKLIILHDQNRFV